MGSKSTLIDYDGTYYKPKIAIMQSNTKAILFYLWFSILLYIGLHKMN